MNRFYDIIADALILFAVSTALVVLADRGFSTLKDKTPKDDPIVTAIVQDDTKSLTKLVKEGSSVTQIADPIGRTALMRAAYANISNEKLLADTDAKRAPMIDLLIANGANINATDHDGWTPLMWAAWSNMPKSATILLDKGAQSITEDKRGNSALDLAARRGNLELVRLLASSGDKASAIAQAKTGMAENADREKTYTEILRLLAP